MLLFCLNICFRLRLVMVSLLWQLLVLKWVGLVGLSEVLSELCRWQVKLLLLQFRLVLQFYLFYWLCVLVMVCMLWFLFLEIGWQLLGYICVQLVLLFGQWKQLVFLLLCWLNVLKKQSLDVCLNGSLVLIQVLRFLVWLLFSMQLCLFCSVRLVVFWFYGGIWLKLVWLVFLWFFSFRFMCRKLLLLFSVVLILVLRQLVWLLVRVWLIGLRLV